MQIAILDDYQDVALELAPWDELGDEFRVTRFADTLTDDDALVARLVGFDAIVAMRERTPFQRALLEKLPQLELLVTTGMRNASIDMQAAAELGVTVCGTGGARNSTGELTMGLILAVARKLTVEFGNMRAGRWQTTLGEGLAGRTLGIVGLGRIGSQMARLGNAFEMQVVAWSPNMTAERAAAAGVRAMSLEELLGAADFVSLHMRLADYSRGMLGADELARMRRSAYLINTARGPLVDEEALVATLTERRIAGAGLDVFHTEPLPADHPLRTLDNVVLTPHLGYVVREGYEAMYGDALEDIRAFADGKPIRVLRA